MDRVPRIKSVAVVGTAKLLVHFEDGDQRVYDCGPLLDRPRFQLLSNPAFFRAVHVDAGGYGLSWNDDVDSSESSFGPMGSLLTAELARLRDQAATRANTVKARVRIHDLIKWPGSPAPAASASVRNLGRRLVTPARKTVANCGGKSWETRGRIVITVAILSTVLIEAATLYLRFRSGIGRRVQ